MVGNKVEWLGNINMNSNLHVVRREIIAHEVAVHFRQQRIALQTLLQLQKPMSGHLHRSA